MIDEGSEPTPQDQVPLGWEPLADFGRDRVAADQTLNDHKRSGKTVMLVIAPDRSLSLWHRTHRDWPFQ